MLAAGTSGAQEIAERTVRPSRQRRTVAAQGLDQVREGREGLLKQLLPAGVTSEASRAVLETAAQPGRGVAERAQKRHRIFAKDASECGEQQPANWPALWPPIWYTHI